MDRNSEEWKALNTMAEMMMRDTLGDEEYERHYDEDGNRRPHAQWLHDGKPMSVELQHCWLGSSWVCGRVERS